MKLKSIVAVAFMSVLLLVGCDFKSQSDENLTQNTNNQNEKQVKKSPEKTKSPKQACDSGDMAGCFDLAYSYEYATAGKADKQKAAKLYQKACDGKNMKACYYLGYLYIKGSGVEQDKHKAVELFEKACDGGDMFGCLNLGHMTAKGNGIEQNQQKAKELYKKACDSGIEAGCPFYKILNEQTNTL